MHGVRAVWTEVAVPACSCASEAVPLSVDRDCARSSPCHAMLVGCEMCFSLQRLWFRQNFELANGHCGLRSCGALLVVSRGMTPPFGLCC